MARGEGTGCLTVNNVRGDGQHRLGRDCITVHGDCANLIHDGVNDGCCNIVCTVVIVTVGREVSLGAVVDNQSGFVANRVNLRVLDSGQGVSNDGQASNTATHGANDLGIVQRHLDCLVGVAIVAVVDDVQGLDVGANNPVQHLFVLCPDLVEVERAVTLNGLVAFHDLLSAHLIAATVDGVEESLCRVHAGAEELHLLANAHGGNTACDGCVIAPVLTNLLIGFVLNGGGLNRDQCAEFLVALGELLIPEDGDVRLGCGAEVTQGLQETEGGLGNQGTSVFAEACIRPGCPVGVAGEDLIVIDRAQEAGNAELDDQRVDDLLGLELGEGSTIKIALEVAVEECGETADRHCGAVLGLHGGQVAEVGPLHCFVCVASGAGDVEAVVGCHLLELLQSLDLLRVLLAVACPVL